MFIFQDSPSSTRSDLVSVTQTISYIQCITLAITTVDNNKVKKSTTDRSFIFVHVYDLITQAEKIFQITILIDITTL